MIASCPSCGTLYKHEEPEAPARGRCASCEAVVHLAARRQYAVVGAEETVRRAEPVLARAQVTTTGGASKAPPDAGSQGGSGAAPLAFDRLAADGGGGTSAAFSMALPSATRSDDVAAGSEADAAPAPRDATPRSRSLAGLLAGSALGCLAGMVGSWRLEGDPLIWWIGGAFIGAIAGWGFGVRWTSRKA